MRESQIEKAVCVYAKARGWLSIKLAGPGDRGKPDRLFLAKGGRVKFIEFKAPGKKPTLLQADTLDRLWAFGFEVHVVDHPLQAKEIFGE